MYQQRFLCDLCSDTGKTGLFFRKTCRQCGGNPDEYRKKLAKDWLDKVRPLPPQRPQKESKNLIEMLESKKVIEGIVIARKCDCCGHHEVGVNSKGAYWPIKPGDKVILEQPEDK